MAYKGKIWGGGIGYLGVKPNEDIDVREAVQGWAVHWVRSGRRSRVTTSDLLTLEDDPAGDLAAVFARRGDWLLVRSAGAKGWGWTRFDAESMVFNPIPESRDWVEASNRASGGNSVLLIRDKAGPLRESPDLRSNAVVGLRDKPWRRYSEHRGYGWSPDSTWIRVVEQRGDWVRVILPRSEQKLPGVEEETYTLKLEWNPDRTGWVKWKRPGPVRGSWDSWIKWASIGTTTNQNTVCAIERK
jgi:hypothetical protein